MIHSVVFFALMSMRPVDPLDQIEDLAQGMPIINHFYLLYKKAPMAAQLPLKPWADQSWRLSTGGIAERYENQFQSFSSYDHRLRYVQSHPMRRILQNPNEKERAKMIAKLSAAEKYDLLVGDENETLTKAMWAEGYRFRNEQAVVDWKGICEGSARAGSFLPEPVKRVTLYSRVGHYPIVFEPLDIKGLASLLLSDFGVSQNSIAVVGTRVFEKNDPRRQETAEEREEAKFNTNPATLHLALLNFIGLHQRVFFADRAQDESVQSSPIIAYSSQYYDVMTKERNSDGKGMLYDLDVLRTQEKRLKRKFLVHEPAAGTKYIIGFETEMTYATNYGTASRYGSSPMGQMKIRMRYYLEADAAGKIIGGEWLTEDHPDFLWALPENFLEKFQPIADKEIGGNPVWSENTVPDNWLEAIQHSSAQLQPMKAIVLRLVEMSSAKN